MCIPPLWKHGVGATVGGFCDPSPIRRFHLHLGFAHPIRIRQPHNLRHPHIVVEQRVLVAVTTVLSCVVSLPSPLPLERLALAWKLMPFCSPNPKVTPNPALLPLLVLCSSAVFFAACRSMSPAACRLMSCACSLAPVAARLPSRAWMSIWAAWMVVPVCWVVVWRSSCRDLLLPMVALIPMPAEPGSPGLATAPALAVRSLSVVPASL